MKNNSWRWKEWILCWCKSQKVWPSHSGALIYTSRKDFRGSEKNSVSKRISSNPERERNRAACVGQVGDTVRKHVTTPRCRSRPHHSSSRCPRPPRRRRRSSHRRHRSLRRGQGRACERSIQLALWGPSRHHVQLLLWWPKPVSWDS